MNKSSSGKLAMSKHNGRICNSLHVVRRVTSNSTLLRRRKDQKTNNFLPTAIITAADVNFVSDAAANSFKTGRFASLSTSRHSECSRVNKFDKDTLFSLTRQNVSQVPFSFSRLFSYFYARALRILYIRKTERRKWKRKIISPIRHRRGHPPP